MHISCQILLGSPDHTLTTKYPTQTFSSCLHPILPFLFTSHPSLPVYIPSFTSCLHSVLHFLFTCRPSLPVYIPSFPSCLHLVLPFLFQPILPFLFTSHPSLPVYIPSFLSCLHPILPFLFTSHPFLPVYIPSFPSCLHPILPFLFTSHPSLPVYIPSFPSCLHPILPFLFTYHPSFIFTFNLIRQSFVNRVCNFARRFTWIYNFSPFKKLLTRAKSPPFFMHSSPSNICLWKGGDISSSPPLPIIGICFTQLPFLWISLNNLF